jgi:DNA-binding CsgD family transcriptional regulator
MARPVGTRGVPWVHAYELIERTCAAPLDDRVLRATILEQIRPVVPFDAYVWVLTDPATTVGASPVAEVPFLGDLPSVIRLKYLTPINRWTGLPRDRVVTLVEATGGALERSLLWRELLHDYAVHDVVSAVLRDATGCWGFLDLWRLDRHRTAFTPEEQAFLNAVLPLATQALRTSLAATFTVPARPGPPDGPSVLLLTDQLQSAGRTRQTDDQLRALLPTPPGHAPLPAIALNVAAQLLAGEAGVDAHPPFARCHQTDGRWIEVRAARISPDPASGPTIAVTIERATPSRRVEVYSRVVALTRRETELLNHLSTGADTRAAARALGVTEYTVNDHLRSVFAKAGTNSRRQLIANATG